MSTLSLRKKMLITTLVIGGVFVGSGVIITQVTPHVVVNAANESKEEKVLTDDIKAASLEYAKYLLEEEGDNPILQVDEVHDGSYEWSLETLLADVAAMQTSDKTAEIVKDICEKNDISTKGRIKDLTPEIIAEIDNQFYLLSGHPM